MGCVRVPKIAEYIADPLQAALDDKDPYVRKTASLCVSKLFLISPDLVIDRQLLQKLKAQLEDKNPAVVVNALISLKEIEMQSYGMNSTPASQTSAVPVSLSAPVVTAWMNKIEAFSEWGMVTILDSVSAAIDRSDNVDLGKIKEKVLPLLNHSNAAVVFSSINLISRLVVKGGAETADVAPKMKAPLVTLLTADPDVQYIALRSTPVLLSTVSSLRPLLAASIRSFFIHYYDPPFVKTSKLALLLDLADSENAHAVLDELAEYCAEADVDFVITSVEAVGKLAVKVESNASQCVAKLLALVQGENVPRYVVQAVVLVMRDVTRRYPGMYETTALTPLAESVENTGVDDGDARAAWFFILGEHAHRMEGGDSLLETAIELFDEEGNAAKLALLTAGVKQMLVNPHGRTSSLVPELLRKVTGESDNPDLRDRAYMYWRMIDADPEFARYVHTPHKK